MHLDIQLLIYFFLAVTAILALYLRDLLAAIVSLSVFSFMCAILFVSQGAIDVGFTEATVGAGITSVLYIVLLYKTKRRSKD